jgi:hypothetical protein
MSKVPQPMRGHPEQLVLSPQVIPGIEVDELTAVRVLDAATWEQRRQRLEKLGGPPENDWSVTSLRIAGPFLLSPVTRQISLMSESGISTVIFILSAYQSSAGQAARSYEGTD